MQVPLLDLKAQLAPLKAEIMDAIEEVIDSTCYILGPKVEELESEVAAYCGSRFGIGMSSGTDALLAALMGLGVKPGDLVLTTAYTFFATMGCILRLGARPLFADIDPVTYNIDPDHMAALLTADSDRTARIKAVMPVHLYGQCADMDPIMALAAEYGIPVVEDAAQAIGAQYPASADGGVRWRRAGSMGLAGCFSFFPSKNLGGIGDGGMVVTDDERLAEKLRIIRVHGGAPKYHHAMLGGNFRLDPIQAVVLGLKLAHLPDWHRARRRNAGRYHRLFAEAGLVADDLLRLPQAVYQGQAGESDAVDYHIYNQYVLRAPDRDELIKFLHAEGVGAEIYYPIPLHRQQCVADLGYDRLELPETEKAAAETLALPVYPELTDAQQQYVVARIAAFYRR